MDKKNSLLFIALLFCLLLTAKAENTEDLIGQSDSTNTTEIDEEDNSTDTNTTDPETEDDPEEQVTDEANLPLILGLSIPLLFIIASLIIIIKTNSVSSNQNEQFDQKVESQDKLDENIQI